MSDSDSSALEAMPTPQEIEFVQRYCWKQLEHLGQGGIEVILHALR